MQVGATVEILEPFSGSYPGRHFVSEVNEAETFVYLEGIEPAFDFIYVRIVEG